MSKQLLLKLWTELAEARRQLVRILHRTYGDQINLFLPSALQFLQAGGQDFELRRLLYTLSRTIQEAGPFTLGGEYRLPMTRNLLSLLICEHGWIPDQLPAFPDGLPPDDEAGEALQRVRDLREELALQQRLLRQKAMETPEAQAQL